MDTLEKIAMDATRQSVNFDRSMAIIDHMWDDLKTSDGDTWTA
jgi:hypothetical protein